MTRALRGFADGLVSVLLAGYLTRLGFTPLQVGAIVTGTLLGSAALTTIVGLAGQALERRRVLLFAALLMLATGLGFAGLRAFWPLLAVAVVGTLNPTAGDVSVFLPVEQAVLAETVGGSERTAVFAWYNVAGTLAGGLGALAGGAPEVVARLAGVDPLAAERGGFVFYAAVAAVARIGHVRTMVYTHLPANLFLLAAGVVPSAPLAVAFLLLRASMSQMDVPARQAYVMSLVPPEERMAASSVTNVPRSLAAAIPPLFTGILLDRSSFGWPLVLGGALKALYDVLLLVQFRTLRPPAEP